MYQVKRGRGGRRNRKLHRARARNWKRRLTYECRVCGGLIHTVPEILGWYEHDTFELCPHWVRPHLTL